MEDIEDLPSLDFTTLYSRLSVLEYRRHLPSAMLMAYIANALGGKGDSKALASHKRYEAEEFLPGFARPPMLTRDLPLTPAQCKAVMEGVGARELPSWAVQLLHQIMPMGQIMRHGGTSAVSEEDEWERQLESAERWTND
ncbi:hypothetical protein [Deinococcus rubellus]